MSSARRRDWCLFALACALLVGAALRFGSPPPPSPPAGDSAGAALAAASESPRPRATALRARVAASARRFLAAFFRYEVGAGGSGLRRRLRSTATSGFAAQLLATRPRLPALPAPPARLLGLQVGVASISPPRALVSGAAARGPEREQFSFLFARRGGRWLAIGPGQ